MESYHKRVADSVWFVVPAYLLAIATWSLISSHDFISSSWRKVSQTRKRGRQHLAVVSLPMIYMIVYMYFQIRSADYKEFSAAMVACGFAVLHMLRTVMGLWQLHVFKQWAMTSIMSMEALGCRIGADSGDGKMVSSREHLAKESSKDRKRRIGEIADEMSVNETIVDNRLFEGDVCCTVHFLTNEEKNDIKKCSSNLGKFLLKSKYAVASVVRLFGIVWPLMISNSTILSTSNSAPYLSPRQPEEIWLSWAMALVSHAFPDWVVEMKRSEAESKGSEYDIEQENFAAEVLRCAALHSNRDGASVRFRKDDEGVVGNNQMAASAVEQMTGNSFLPYDHWRKFSMLCRGRFCKNEFLAYACRTGTGLPFGYPHSDAKASDMNNSSYSYSRFQSKLVRARDLLPAEEGEKVRDLDFKILEWLAACLCAGSWATCQIIVDKKIEEQRLKDASSVSSSNIETPSQRHTDGKTSTGTNIALQNLATQLGFGDDSKMLLARFSDSFWRERERNILWTNRNVLELSVHVDNWIAICAGEQTAYMAKKVPGMSVGALLKESASDGISEECVRLEKLRFMFQISIVDPEHSYFDQSIGFMGVSMENLRSLLAGWVETHGHVDDDVWNPRIGSRGNSEEVKFSASPNFESLLTALCDASCLSQRYVQMRLLWELQDNLQTILRDHECRPDHPAALMLCLLSFPALCITVTRNEGQADEVDEHPSSKQFCCIYIGEEDVKEFRVAEHTVEIQAALGPQDLALHISFSRMIDGSPVAMSARLYQRDLGPESLFHWQSWRDAFSGSLEGMRAWKDQHGLPFVPTVHSNVGIGAGVCDVNMSSATTGRG